MGHPVNDGFNISGRKYTKSLATFPDRGCCRGARASRPTVFPSYVIIPSFVTLYRCHMGELFKALSWSWLTLARCTWLVMGTRLIKVHLWMVLNNFNLWVFKVISWARRNYSAAVVDFERLKACLQDNAEILFITYSSMRHKYYFLTIKFIAANALIHPKAKLLFNSLGRACVLLDGNVCSAQVRYCLCIHHWACLLPLMIACRKLQTWSSHIQTCIRRPVPKRSIPQVEERFECLPPYHHQIHPSVGMVSGFNVQLQQWAHVVAHAGVEFSVLICVFDQVFIETNTSRFEDGNDGRTAKAKVAFFFSLWNWRPDSERLTDASNACGSDFHQ